MVSKPKPQPVVDRLYRLKVFIGNVSFPLLSPARASLIELEPLREQLPMEYVVLVETLDLDGQIVSSTLSSQILWR